MAVGFLYTMSVILLSVVVAVVYSVAQEAFAPPKAVAKQAVRRGAKLAAVLAGLALLVQILSRL